MITSGISNKTTETANSAQVANEDSNVRKPLSWSDFVAARQHAALIANQRPIPIASPVHTVFGIWELCENILQNLSCIDLERIKSLNPTCNAVVNRSGFLQQTRCLEPRPMSSARTTSASSVYDQRLISPRVNNVYTIAQLVQDASLADFVFDLHLLLKIKEGRYIFRNWGTFGMPRFGIEFRDVNRLAAISRHASLNNRFLSQTPVQDIRIHIMGHVKRKHRRRHLNCVEIIVLNNAGGVTFGQVFEKVGQSICRFHDARVGYMTFG
jgi:hypothetical protein